MINATQIKPHAEPRLGVTGEWQMIRLLCSHGPREGSPS